MPFIWLLLVISSSLFSSVDSLLSSTAPDHHQQQRQQQQQQRQSDVLFVLHDAGEALGLQPVVDALIAAEAGGGPSCLVLTLGSPADSIYAGYPQALSLADLGVTAGAQEGDQLRRGTRAASSCSAGRTSGG
jgi:hypothetical protein